MVADTDQHWRKWAKIDPYYAVFSFDKFRKSQIATTRQEFFDTGTTHVDDILATLRCHFGDLGRGSALDFGCGVGRIAIALSPHFNNVTGVDISEDMLEETRSNLGKFGVHNVSLATSDDRLLKVSGQFDLVHCYNVLQHIPVARGETIVEELLRRVKPGGNVVIHLSLRRGYSPLRRMAYFARHNVPLCGYTSNILVGRKWDEPPMQMNEYDAVRILRLFAEHGMKEVLTIQEEHGPITTAFFFGRKPADIATATVETLPG